MTKHIFALFFFVFLSKITFSQSQYFVREEDKNTGKPLLRGKITFDNIKEESTCSWFEEGAEAYTPNMEVINELSKDWKNYRFVVFAGTWCEDTQDLLPKFYRTITDANIPIYAIEMYGVNRNKQSLQQENKYYKIERVPTIIIMHQMREVGRIVETVNQSIEQDILVIMQKDIQYLEAKKIEDERINEERKAEEIRQMKPRERKRYYKAQPFY